MGCVLEAPALNFCRILEAPALDFCRILEAPGCILEAPALDFCRILEAPGYILEAPDIDGCDQERPGHEKNGRRFSIPRDAAKDKVCYLGEDSRN